MPSPNFQSFRELQNATLAQKLSLGVSGTTSECNAERVKIAELLEEQRLNYIYSEYTQHQSHERLSSDDILPPDPAVAAVLAAQGDVRKILDHPRCAENLVEAPDEEFFHFQVEEKEAELLEATEELRGDYGIDSVGDGGQESPNPDHAMRNGSAPKAASQAHRSVKARSYTPFPRPAGLTAATDGIVPPSTPPPMNGIDGPSL
ncbi:hypothetical protein [Glutamicibacter sp. FBE19]|uniref:hypothetical protein n=1 Tax=Glutamicibacter sp. FBE19 TaxID=2761534 RepID=UPI00189664E7|nr:hypothetical protein [Glutamicibacter sp. FBE19]MBF6671152.1 hypothetical protein [Glutamicibacter sp. FBE19]